MSKGPGNSSSTKIIPYDEQELSQGKQDERTAYPKSKLEFTSFSSPKRDVSLPRIPTGYPTGYSTG